MLSYSKYGSEAAAATTSHVNIHHFGGKRMGINDNLPMQRKMIMGCWNIETKQSKETLSTYPVHLSVSFFAAGGISHIKKFDAVE
jgi:hypothetical protein